MKCNIVIVTIRVKDTCNMMYKIGLRNLYDPIDQALYFGGNVCVTNNNTRRSCFCKFYFIYFISSNIVAAYEK